MTGSFVIIMLKRLLENNVFCENKKCPFHVLEPLEISLISAGKYTSGGSSVAPSLNSKTDTIIYHIFHPLSQFHQHLHPKIHISPPLSHQEAEQTLKK